MEYTITDLKKDLEAIQSSIFRIEKQLSSELYTVTKEKDAEELFGRLTDVVNSGQGVELIVRRY
jgi:cob(I)alamin adenosyltransferase